MKRTLITAAVLVTCAGTQLFAQNFKEDVLTFNLSRQYQVSVSDSAALNHGLWTAPPTQYKTKTTKLVTADILRAIAVVLYGNPNAYSAQAKIVLVQGELSGFFGLQATGNGANTTVTNNPLFNATIGDNGIGTFTPGTSLSTESLDYRLDTGRNFAANPEDGRLAPGHDQPWGQVFVKDRNATVCDNVTFFFTFDVQECYDCFYLNSFISDAKFAFQAKAGPPCCAGTTANNASGKDRYFMFLGFDNTYITNPYLNDTQPQFVGNNPVFAAAYPNFTVGLVESADDGETDDGVHPDGLFYDSSIINNVSNPALSHSYDVYVMRFNVGGIVSYSWSLKLLNPTDPIQEFLGSAQYPAYGYGFIGKVCSFISGTTSFAEKSVKATTCCIDAPWSDSWYGLQFGVFDAFPSEINLPEALTYHIDPSPTGL
jgi:hypothetical protein